MLRLQNICVRWKGLILLLGVDFGAQPGVQSQEHIGWKEGPSSLSSYADLCKPIPSCSLNSSPRRGPTVLFKETRALP